MPAVVVVVVAVNVVDVTVVTVELVVVHSPHVAGHVYLAMGSDAQSAVAHDAGS